MRGTEPPPYVLNGAFTALTDDGAQAFLYRAAGPEAAEEGALDLDDDSDGER
jgi:hypothetical protein